MKRIQHKDMEQACARYNAALKLHYWRGNKPPSIGFLQWADIKGDGHSRRGLWQVVNETGGVASCYDLRRATMRKTIHAINLAIKFDRLESYQVILQAIHERGETQKAALRELRLRGLWLSEEQKAQAGLVRQYKRHTRHGFLISRDAGPDAPWRGWREDGVTFRADTLQGAFAMASEHKQERSPRHERDAPPYLSY